MTLKCIDKLLKGLGVRLFFQGVNLTIQPILTSVDQIWPCDKKNYVNFQRNRDKPMKEKERKKTDMNHNLFQAIINLSSCFW